MTKHVIKDTTYTKLIDLTKILNTGYTVRVKGDRIEQYSNTDKPFIISYKTLIQIQKDNIIYKNGILPKTAIIGYWSDSDGIGYIELNKTFKERDDALKFAVRHKQQYIYDLRQEKAIKV